jgi:hypothetical protein
LILSIKSGAFSLSMKHRIAVYIFIFSILLLISFSGCLEEEAPPFTTVTEEILYLSGERVIIVGRILSLGKEAVQDHGFQISTSSDFSNPIIISLGLRDKPGRFVGENANLALSTAYYCRSYIALQDETIWGNVLQFTTLETDITGFSPAIASAGENLIINGKNFTDNTEVYFGNVKAEISELLFESQLTVKIPPIGDDYLVQISVKTQNQILTFEKPFEYVTGNWTKAVDFVNNLQLIESLFFKQDQQFIFGLGRVGNNINNIIWSLDLESFSWSETNYNGNALAGSFYTSGYFGSGINVFSPFGTQLSNQLWSYNNGVYTARPNTPFAIYKSIAFTIDNFLFVAGGTFNLRDFERNIWRLNLSNNSWQIVSTSPVPLQVENPSFTYSGSQYFVIPDGSVLKYSPSSNTWETIAKYPIDNFGIDGLAAVINDKAYIGLNSSPILYEFDINTHEWKRKNPIPAGLTQRNAAFFTHNNAVYVLRRYSGPAINPMPTMALWKFEPDSW